MMKIVLFHIIYLSIYRLTDKFPCVYLMLIELTTTTEATPTSCDQALGSTLMGTVGGMLGIQDMRDCQTSTSYTNELSMTLREVCDTSIGTLLNRLPGGNEVKGEILALMPTFQIDPATTKFKALCQCSCAEGNRL